MLIKGARLENRTTLLTALDFIEFTSLDDSMTELGINCPAEPMPLTLSPAHNPVLLLYQMFAWPGVEVDDGRDFLTVRRLGLAELGGDAARDLVALLHRARAMLSTCSLSLGRRRLVSFVATQVDDWFDWQMIDDLAADGLLGEQARHAFAEIKDIVRLRYFPPDTDPVHECLSILEDLAECAERFTLDIRLDKSEAVKAFLLPASATGISASVWYDVDSFRREFEGFDDFLAYFEKQARRPVAILFFQPVEEYASNYLRVLCLQDPAAPELRRSALAAELEALASAAVGLRRLLDRHRGERRGRGGRFDLPPALLLPRGGGLGDERHPLFARGPLRSLLLYMVLAWLADNTDRENACFTFFEQREAEPDLAAPDPAEADGQARVELSLQFGLSDVGHEGDSLFQDPEQWRLLGPLARAVQRSAGNEGLRKLWARAVGAAPAGAFAAGGLWQGLAAVHRAFLVLEQTAEGRIPKELDQPPRDKQEAAAREQAREQKRYGELPDFEMRIFVEERGIDSYARFELHGPFHGLFHEDLGSERLPRHPAAHDDEYDELSNMARSEMTRLLEPDPRHPGDWRPEVPGLAKWGGRQWNRRIPRELKEQYFKIRRERGLSLLIVSSDPSFPWELTKPYRGRDIDDDFWAMQFRLGRWLAGQPPPADEIRCERVLCVSTPCLEMAAEERQYFEGLRSQLRTLEMPETKERLLELLEEQTFDIIHFACHGAFSAGHPEDSVVKLPDGNHLTVGELYNGKIEAGIKEGRPLIFLNACHTGRVGTPRTDVGGWAKRFIAMGCGAFIGCGWEVADPAAARFATTFYDHLRRRDQAGGPAATLPAATLPAATLGEAVHVARQAVRDERNSTWLAYYLYGNPNCRLV